MGGEGREFEKEESNLFDKMLDHIFATLTFMVMGAWNAYLLHIFAKYLGYSEANNRESLKFTATLTFCVFFAFGILSMASSWGYQHHLLLHEH